MSSLGRGITLALFWYNARQNGMWPDSGTDMPLLNIWAAVGWSLATWQAGCLETLRMDVQEEYYPCILELSCCTPVIAFPCYWSLSVTHSGVKSSQVYVAHLRKTWNTIKISYHLFWEDINVAALFSCSFVMIINHSGCFMNVKSCPGMVQWGMGCFIHSFQHSQLQPILLCAKHFPWRI